VGTSITRKVVFSAFPGAAFHRESLFLTRADILRTVPARDSTTCGQTSSERASAANNAVARQVAGQIRRRAILSRTFTAAAQRSMLISASSGSWVKLGDLVFTR